MWYFTRYGFFSVAQVKGKKDAMVIRARCKRHIGSLCTRFAALNLQWQETPKGDYRYRVTVSRMQWVKIASELAVEVHWDNVKNEVKRFQGGPNAYTEAMRDIWGMLLWQLQAKEKEQ